jgi:hypothetical protein
MRRPVHDRHTILPAPATGSSLYSREIERQCHVVDLDVELAYQTHIQLSWTYTLYTILHLTPQTYEHTGKSKEGMAAVAVSLMGMNEAQLRQGVEESPKQVNTRDRNGSTPL